MHPRKTDASTHRFARTSSSGILSGYQVPRSEMVNPGLRAATMTRLWGLIGGLLAACAANLPLVRADEPTHDEAQHWAFRPVQRPNIPQVRHPELVRTPVDAFLLARLEEK